MRGTLDDAQSEGGAANVGRRWRPIVARHALAVAVAVLAASTLAGTERVEATSNTWSAAASMSSARYAHTATLLPNGNVLQGGNHGDR